MIEAIEGRVGAGKSFNAVMRAVSHWVNGGCVATNLPIKWDAVKAYAADRFSVELVDGQFVRLEHEQVRCFQKHIPMGTFECPVLVIIDEAQLFWSSMTNSEDKRDCLDTFKFLTHSRHYHVDLLFITQSMLNVNPQFARMCEFVYRYRDMEKLVVPWLGIRLPYYGNKILESKFEAMSRAFQARRWISKDRRIFALYDSFSHVKSFELLENIETRFKLRKIQKPKLCLKSLLLPLVPYFVLGASASIGYFIPLPSSAKPWLLAHLPASLVHRLEPAP